MVVVCAEQGVKARGWDPNGFWGVGVLSSEPPQIYRGYGDHPLRLHVTSNAYYPDANNVVTDTIRLTLSTQTNQSHSCGSRRLYPAGGINGGFFVYLFFKYMIFIIIYTIFGGQRGIRTPDTL